MGDHAGPHGLFDREELRKRHLLTLGIGHIDGRESLRSGPTHFVGLHVDPTHLALLEGVVHVGPTKVDAERGHGGTEVHPERCHLLTIHIDLVLRRLR